MANPLGKTGEASSQQTTRPLVGAGGGDQHWAALFHSTHEKGYHAAGGVRRGGCFLSVMHADLLDLVLETMGGGYSHES